MLNQTTTIFPGNPLSFRRIRRKEASRKLIKFVAHIRATYGDSKHARACLAAVELAKIQIDISAADNVVLIP